MLGKSHLFYGLTAGAAVDVVLAHHVQSLPLTEAALAGVVGGLLPDLDEPGSTISNAPRILGREAQRLVRRAARGAGMRLLGFAAGALIGLVAAILNVLSRGLSHLVRFLAGGHREGSHWFPVWLGLSLAVYMLTALVWGPWLALGFCVGYLSHLASDGCTRSGIPLVPHTRARLHLLPRPLRVRTGTAGETVFTVLYAVALIALIAALYRYGVVAV